MLLPTLDYKKFLPTIAAGISLRITAKKSSTPIVDGMKGRNPVLQVQQAIIKDFGGSQLPRAPEEIFLWMGVSIVT